ncbi:MAG: hypothetical protein QG604_752 [Candidatus Dependentiae bacterium]|nr:hypothetical protein [Candidatus Dependentiae bacterium]
MNKKLLWGIVIIFSIGLNASDSDSISDFGHDELVMSSQQLYESLVHDVGNIFRHHEYLEFKYDAKTYLEAKCMIADLDMAFFIDSLMNGVFIDTPSQATAPDKARVEINQCMKVQLVMASSCHAAIDDLLALLSTGDQESLEPAALLHLYQVRQALEAYLSKYEAAYPIDVFAEE